MECLHCFFKLSDYYKWLMDEIILFWIGYRNVISAIDRRFAFLESQNADEFECAIEALGQTGLCK